MDSMTLNITYFGMLVMAFGNSKSVVVLRVFGDISIQIENG